MALLATQLDLEKYGHLDITAEPDASITARLESASAIIESYCNRVFSKDAAVAETHDGGHPTLFLRQPPVTAIASVVEDSVALAATDYRFYADGRLLRMSGDYRMIWVRKLQTVVVTYTGGYDPIPFDVRLVCVRIAERAFKAASAFAAAAAGAESIESITLVGSDSVTWADSVTTSTSEAAPPLTVEDKEILNPYRLVSIG